MNFFRNYEFPTTRGKQMSNKKNRQLLFTQTEPLV